MIDLNHGRCHHHEALKEHARGCVDKEVVVRQHEPPVHYLECTTGDPTGPAVVYLHGLFGSRFEWCRAVPSLAAEGSLRVLAPDLRGFGHSTATTATVECTVAQMAADVVALLDALELRTVRLIGFSMGGLVAFHLSMFFPERIEDLVIIGSTVTANLPVLHHWWSATPEQADTHSKDTRPIGLADALYQSAMRFPEDAALSSTHALDLFGLSVDPRKPAYAPMAAALAQYDQLPGGPITAPGIVAGPLTGLPRVTESIPGFAICRSHPVKAQTVQAYLRELVVTDFAPHVHRLRARTLLLWGACDMLFSEAARRYTVDALPSETTRSKEYALGSHFVHAEKQHMDNVVTDIVAFFADRP